jgi:hypothetical protein
MRARPRTTRSAVMVVAGTVLLLGGCSGTKSVDREQVERQVSEQLTKQVGQKPDAISCPDDLAAKKGTTMRCKLTSAGSSIGLTVKVTSVDGSKVGFDIKVDDK